VSADWTIDTIVHALPSPDMRQQALKEMHLAPEGELPDVVAKWRRTAEHWVTVQAPAIDEARAHFEQHGHAPAKYELETEDSRAAHQAWRARMTAARRERGAA
jgi:hypothetical protein